MDTQVSLDLQLGEDLLSASQHHIGFLKLVDQYPELYGGPVLQRAVWRYTKLWLPLVTEYSDEVLSAPLDIEWVWHCHMLSPLLYEHDCLHLCGSAARHTILDKVKYEQTLAFAEKYWMRKYPGEAFQVDLEHSDDPLPSDILQSRSGAKSLSQALCLRYDLESAASRQKVFYYQVSLPHYKDERFLARALERYKKFLTLKSLHPNTFLVPCYDIDLMWHTHMNFPQVYKQDTERILGKMLNHDDSVNDRTEGSKLVKSDITTRGLWKALYNEHFSAFGAMYRGDPPTGKLSKMTANAVFNLVSKHADINFNKVEITNGEVDAKFKVYIKEKYNFVMSQGMAREDKFDISEKLITLKGPDRVWHSSGSIKKWLHTMDDNNVHVQVLKPQSFLCCTSRHSPEGEQNIDLGALANNFTEVETPIRETVKLDLDSNLAVTLDMTLTMTKVGQCDLWLVPGSYEECVMPEQIEQLWGPVPLPRLPHGMENNCSVASHKVMNYRGKVAFTCRVVHSLPLMMSAIQVYFHDRMVAVSHVIGSDQLPKPHEVTLFNIQSNKTEPTRIDLVVICPCDNGAHNVNGLGWPINEHSFGMCV